MPPTSPTPSEPDLDWLAFCYAAGELSAAEQADFEARLVTDQPTREALARAVELIQATLAVPAASATPAAANVAAVSTAAISETTTGTSGRRRLWAAAISLAASLALVVGLNFRDPAETPVSPADQIAADAAASPPQSGRFEESGHGQAGPQHPASVDGDNSLASTTDDGTIPPQTGSLQGMASRLLTLWSDSADVSQIGLMDGELVHGALTAADLHRLEQTDDGIDERDADGGAHASPAVDHDDFAAADLARDGLHDPSFESGHGSQDNGLYEGDAFTEADFAIPSWMLAAVSADGNAPAQEHPSDDWFDAPEPDARPQEN